ncbi:hypothetical protein N9O13_05115 [Crocinitomicaceae bacterium]|nr:hypothetical protein [Crocinitomicaceae bacterium]
MKEYQPIHVLFFLLFTAMILLPIVYFAPKDGYNVFGINISFLTWEKLLNPVKQEHKNLDFLNEVNINDNLDTEFLKNANSDSISLGLPTKDTVLAVKSKTKLHMNEISQSNLFSFFSELSSVSKKSKKINICHYGDSQIEGDRMTAFIRQRLQTQFGGAGPGLIPTINAYSTISFKQKYSANFKRKILFGKDKLYNNQYGIMLSSAIFEVDSSNSRKGIPTEAWIEINPSNVAYSRCKAYNNLSVYYNSCNARCSIEIYNNEQLITKDTLNSDGLPHAFNWRFSSTPEKLKIVFKSTQSPIINGISIEGDIGVQMSNIAMRGSSGTSFGAVDYGSMSFMHKTLNTKLIILQFGGNSVPHFKDSSAVKNYAYRFKKQIEYVQRCSRNAAIIVIGPSDMAQYKEGIYSTYKFLPYCVQQMKKQSLIAGASYWDLYDAMGGKNSMFAWVNNGLAGKDYVHFSNKGASKASQLFYNAFISTYKQWEYNNLSINNKADDNPE